MKTGGFDAKRLRVILILVYFAGLLPLLVAGWYNYPSADDFSMSYYVHEAFLASGGNPFVALREALVRTVYFYRNWTGYYFASFFMVLPPNVFGERWYVLTTPLILAVYTAGVWFFVRQLFTRVFRVAKEFADCVALVILLITVQCMMEGPARVESFFWYCGSVNYTFLYAVGLFWLGGLVRMVTSGPRALPVILASLLGFLLGGANYMTALSLAVVSACLIVLAVRKKIPRILIVPCALEIIGLVCSAVAPGNAVRLALLDEAPFPAVKAVFMGLYYTFSYCISEWTTWAVLALLLLASPLLYHAAKSSPFAFRHPVIVCALAYGLTSCNIVPPVYAMRNIEAGRMQAVVFEQYILLLVIAMFYCMGFFLKRGQASAAPAAPTRRFYMAACGLALFGALLSVYVNPHFFSATGALRDVVSGDAATYREDCLAREQILKDDEVKDAVLPDFRVKPLTLYYDDIRQDPAEWENESMARYYGKDSVRLEPLEKEDGR